ncbi:ubiquitin-like-specific protease 1D [Olea europaea var. sylvestris]|uniref:ubiquitin-like-specific protease 1D n=1 Tax=Olea europaea var. sylvestris TaxID=158386 RepID=UPI000C1D610A|nr:ubiquitin-like-specific protease 1D [Olea europaea var. sylvestris]
MYQCPWQHTPRDRNTFVLFSCHSPFNTYGCNFVNNLWHNMVDILNLFNSPFFSFSFSFFFLHLRMDSSDVQASHDLTQNNFGKTVVLLDEDPEVSDVISQDKVDERIKETRIYYPSRDDPEAVEIGYSDMECLAPESYLSSIIMNFYIRYLQKSISPTCSESDYYHFFNTYFYKKLKQDVLAKNDKETSFVKFRRWWKGVNLFEKAYIFLPVHEE